ncbi:hypothetical protein [Halopseudomonas pertucinogena]|uniref:DnrO protein n=1 Tax=Halopseudomonas pertucinogena TaxID=86175 RepID=A0ABQ2CT03_9GAMM|nr:hypothetical protein [Halopseudomonas pertucinogena]GGI99478.1 hypothetical protein GCM10009083_15290 [Halopseudomonas pertucinogena]
MKIKARQAAIPFALTTALLFCGVSLAADNAALHDHDHGDASFELQLDNGQKWAIDPPLRKAMNDINGAMRSSLEAIHQDRLSDEDYAALANQVNDGVAYMVANCELPPDADAQLHMVIAQLMAGSQKMTGDSDASARDGAVQVLGALDAYAQYFDHADFVPAAH